MKKLLCLSFIFLVLLTTSCTKERPNPLLTLAARPASTADLKASATHRPVFTPGQLVEYFAQTGDNLPMLAARFNSSEDSIRRANPIIPAEVSTLPQGLPMKIPIFFTPFWGNAFKIIPNSAFIFGKEAAGFEFKNFAEEIKDQFDGIRQISESESASAKLIQTCLEASISPRLMLALMEYGLTQGWRLVTDSELLLSELLQGKNTMLTSWLGQLNTAYYQYQTGNLISLDLPDASLERIDPWQNAASAALHAFFSRMLENAEDYQRAVSEDGFAFFYQEIFNDPWLEQREVLPGSLAWPETGMPLLAQGGWQLLESPRAADGLSRWPGAGIGFHASFQNANDGNSYGKVFAIHSGKIIRMEGFSVVISLGGQTEFEGWSIVYEGITPNTELKPGSFVQAGALIGKVDATQWNSSFWLSRKFNGEWVALDWVVPLNLAGWLASPDEESGSLVLRKGTVEVFSKPGKGQSNVIQ
ncbi:MAG: LysM domain-containing protein [Anaerolineaceae bacterium]|nr:LysM domain-containing protein [Anaerolineaceae bacterium]